MSSKTEKCSVYSVKKSYFERFTCAASYKVFQNEERVVFCLIY